MKQTWIYIAFLLVLVSCEKEPVETVYFDFQGKKGIFITCEGNFMYGNASLSFYDKEEKRIYNQVYFARNKAPLGDVAQSIVSFNNSIFVTVNNSGKIVAIDPETAAFKGIIDGLTSPRYMHFLSENKAYVSDLYARQIAIVDPTNYVQTGSIDVANGNTNFQLHSTEQFAQVGNLVFVTCWSYDQYILVINSETDAVTDSIKTPLQPKDIVVDKNNKLWVMCDGSYEASVLGAEPSTLLRIDPITLTIEQKYTFPAISDSPSQLVINSQKDQLYFISDGVYKMEISDRYLPDNPLIAPGEHLFYSLKIDPENNDIYVADAIDYTQSAIIYRYNKSLELVDSFYVGITPGDYLFKN